MEHTTSELEHGRVDPTDKPDDPLAAAHRKAKRGPLVRPPERRRVDEKTAPPTPDQEGCYYLG